jgi:hypothetical protein
MLSNRNTRSSVDLSTTSIYYLPSNDSIENNTDMNNHVCVSTDIQNTSDMDIIADDNHEKNNEKHHEKSVEIEEGRDIESSEKNRHEEGEGIVTQKSSDVILGKKYVYKYMVKCLCICMYMYVYISI